MDQATDESSGPKDYLLLISAMRSDISFINNTTKPLHEASTFNIAMGAKRRDSLNLLVVPSSLQDFEGPPGLVAW